MTIESVRHLAIAVIGGLLGQYGPRVPFFAAAAFTAVNFFIALAVMRETLPPAARRAFSARRANALGALQAMRRIPMYMADWISKLDAFLALNDRDILTHAGRISHEMAQTKAEQQYDAYHAVNAAAPRTVDTDFDDAIKLLEKQASKGNVS